MEMIKATTPLKTLHPIFYPQPLNQLRPDPITPPSLGMTRAHPDQRDLPLEHSSFVQRNSGRGLLAPPPFPHRLSVNGVPDACKVQINYQSDNNYSAFSQPINTRIRDSEKLAASSHLASSLSLNASSPPPATTRSQGRRVGRVPPIQNRLKLTSLVGRNGILGWPLRT